MNEHADDVNQKEPIAPRLETGAIGIEESTAATNCESAGIGPLLCTFRQLPKPSILQGPT